MSDVVKARIAYGCMLNNLSEEAENEEYLQFLIDMVTYHEQEGPREQFFLKVYEYANQLLLVR